jgi:transposase
VNYYSGKKVIMVLDNVRYYHAKRLKSILEKYKDKIELVFLPAYSPDLNPIERVWWYMRKKITHNRSLESMECRVSKFFAFIEQFSHENETGKNLCNFIVNI